MHRYLFDINGAENHPNALLQTRSSSAELLAFFQAKSPMERQRQKSNIATTFRSVSKIGNNCGTVIVNT